MSTTSSTQPIDDDSEQETPADEVIASFFEALERGEAPDPRQYVARNPQLANELCSFFATYSKLDRIVTPDLLDLPPTLLTPAPHVDPTESVTHGLCARSGQTKVRDLGDYELLEEVARGGMGVIFKARQKSLNRVVAIKMILAGTFASDEEVQRFLQEAESAAQLNHPHIVPIYETGLHEGHRYFSMGFVEGTTLAQQLENGPLTPRLAATIVRQVAEAVHYAHSKGVIHRDLKPSNILIDTAGAPHVSDFGLAKRLECGSDLTGTGQILGTPSYMPPEQAAANLTAMGAWSDVYSLGAVLFCAITGRPPFQASSPLDTLLQVQQQEPVSPRSLNEKIPRDLETIALKCLEKSPARRYTTALELAGELQRFLDGRPILARPVSRIDRTVRWCRRNPVVASLISTVILILSTATIVSSRFAYSERLQSIAATKSQTEERRQRLEALRQAKLARRHLLISQMNLAQAAWENGRIRQTVRLLDLSRPEMQTDDPATDLRGFEWYYWDRWCHSDLMTFEGHTGDVEGLTYSLDGKRIASASADQTVRIWDAVTGRTQSVFREHREPVYCTAFHPQGEMMASAGERSVMIWQAVDGQVLHTLKGHSDRITSIDFSPDGRWLISGSWDDTVKLWDLRSGFEVKTFSGHTSEVWSVAFSPDGHRIASASADHTVNLWDVETGQVVHSMTGHSDRVMSLAFSPDGQRLVSGGRDFSLIVWDAVHGIPLRTLKGHVDRVTNVAFSPDGRRIASSSRDQMIRTWDTESGAELLILRGHADRVTGVAFSPDGQTLASSSWDHTIKLWDSHVAQESIVLSGHTDEVHAVAYRFDGQWLASASFDGTVRVWDLATNRERFVVRGHRAPVTSVAWNADGTRLASASEDRTIKLWDGSTGTELKSLAGHSAGVTAVTFFKNGHRLVSADADGCLKIWDTNDGSELWHVDHRGVAIVGLDCSQESELLVSAAADGTVRLWDASTGRERMTLSSPAGDAFCVAFSPDGKQLASAYSDKTVRIWDVASGTELHALKGHTDVVRGVVFNRDATRIATAGDDRMVKVWDTATGLETLTLNGHTDEVFCVAFSPDGKQLASGSWDKTIRIWDAHPFPRPVAETRMKD